MDERETFLKQLTSDPFDDTARLVFADWLDEHGEADPASRLRWWVSIRVRADAETVWDSPPPVIDAIRWRMDSISSEWAQRLYAVHACRRLGERHPVRYHGTGSRNVAENALLAAELYSLGLADWERVEVARTLARNAVGKVRRFLAQPYGPGDSAEAARKAAHATRWALGAVAEACGGRDGERLPVAASNAAISAVRSAANTGSDHRGSILIGAGAISAAASIALVFTRQQP